MTMDLRFDHSAVVLMKKMPMTLHRIILAAQPPRATVISRRFPPSPTPQHPDSASRLTRRQSSQLVRRMVSGGPMMMSRLVIRARGKDSPTKTRIRFTIG